MLNECRPHYRQLGYKKELVLSFYKKKKKSKNWFEIKTKVNVDFNLYHDFVSK